MKIPDYIEPFHGWKGLLADPRTGTLFSPQFEAEWPAREPFEAKCEREEPHTPPHPSCSCGVYAVDTIETLIAKGYGWGESGSGNVYLNDGRVWVIARVALWGEMRAGTIGFRTHRAYPQTVYVAPQYVKLGQVIRDRYGCNLAFVNRFTGETIEGKV